uniref:NADH dehydrogenase subunit 6 n=1 Tax=Platynereis dumerilii TaxID=6359 RepID=Q9TB54_PLADU|nr:NADH dehydrogenase subunit 6 [Platynereis dumerilii]AAF02693.1 NADH dehydrogenase subunit 6 [Platynereis dumerilii]
MTLLTLNTLVITLFFSCLTSMSPVNLGVTVLMIALTMSTILCMISTSWFSFIMFIIYVGGMLVMFAYFAALQPNQLIAKWNWIIIPSWFMILLIMLSQNTTITWAQHFPNTIELYTVTNMEMPLLLALILFLALVVVIKTARADDGPLRPFN